ncbi:hypothetical protein MCAG_01024 [Micromonospora sp. ATCC 39149]|nr:hypothetical protein MCAG_01024 [Micromonospora sp. ATCC 39149]
MVRAVRVSTAVGPAPPAPTYPLPPAYPTGVPSVRFPRARLMILYWGACPMIGAAAAPAGAVGVSVAGMVGRYGEDVLAGDWRCL